MEKINFKNVFLLLISIIFLIGILALSGILTGHISNCRTAFYPSGDPIYVCTVSNLILFSIFSSILFMGSLFLISVWLIFKAKKTKYLLILISIFWLLYSFLFLGILD